MKAMVITQFGEPNVFEERDLDQPTPGYNEVLVKVCATSVNPADCGVRQGVFGSRIQLPAILGYDVSGVVEAIGPHVQDFRVGDEVYYAIELMNQGANAEYHVVDAEIVAHKPVNLTHPEAASIPVAGGTAWTALCDRAALRVGETILIHGAAGGVGTFAVQIAKAAGAYVFATCGSYDMNLVESLGADRIVDYHQEDVMDIIQTETGGEGVDVSLDTVGGDLLAQSLSVMKAHGRAVTVTGSSSQLNQAISKNITVHFVHLVSSRSTLNAIKRLVDRNLILPIVSKIFPLHQVADAHRCLESSDTSVYGKIAIKVA
jgi:NADPH:quinone reductase